MLTEICVNILFGDSAGDDNQVIMTDFSNPSNIAARDKLLEEYKREYDGAIRRLLGDTPHVAAGFLK